MPLTTPPPGPPKYHPAPQMPRIPLGWALLALIPTLAILGVCYWWFVQRKEVPADKLLVLIRKWGEALPPEAGDNVVLYPELLAKLGEPPDSTRYAGIRYDVLKQGRHFYDPLFWDRVLIPYTYIAEEEVGIAIRKYGRPLPPGKLVATEPDERGPIAEILPQGRSDLNTFAYNVVRVPPVRIPEGSVGVQTLYSGEDSANPNSYVVKPGERGVQPEVLPPGLYRNNPYVRRIDIIDVRSHTIDLLRDDAIHFPSNDSFQILLEGTVEYAIRQDKAPYVLTAIGDHDDVRDKIILPYAKSFSRIEGSKLDARDFISGERRKAFQDQVFTGLRDLCYQQGIEIRAVLFRKIEPPNAIAGPISERQVATQQIRQYENDINVAKSQAQLVEQEELQNQNKEIGGANREVVTVTKQAEQAKAVALTEANKRFEVAKLDLEAARETAAAILSRGTAEAQVVKLGYEAEARPLSEAVQAFGGGEAYAQFYFYQKLAPALKTILDSTGGPFADIFRTLSEVRGSGPPRPSLPQTAGAIETNDASGG